MMQQIPAILSKGKIPEFIEYTAIKLIYNVSLVKTAIRTLSIGVDLKNKIGKK